MGDHTNPGSANGNGAGIPTSTLSTTPFPASQKVYVEGSLPGVRVPMREIRLTPTKSMNGGGAVANAPVTVYDTCLGAQRFADMLETELGQLRIVGALAAVG